MEPTLFDIYLTGRLATGLTAADAAQRLAQLFRTPVETTANLITGKAQLIKRGTDHATALKFRDALQRAGLEIEIRAQAAMTTVAVHTPTVATPAISTPAATTPTAELTLAPVGADVLNPDERVAVAVVSIDTTHLSLAPQVFAPGMPADPSARPAHLDIVAPALTLAPADGELLKPEEKSVPPAQTPDIPDLTLAEPGALLETLQQEVTIVAPDIAGLSVAPADGDLLKPGERPAKPAAPTPDISHLQLSE